MIENGIRPKVSVCVVAYNQENFIRQCLDSILAQQTTFPFEIIVGDDCSKDGTKRIIQEYASLHPEQIRPLFHDQNLGPTKNYRAVHDAARGELIAHIDGDDYMLPGKLQTQADGLDAHPECSLSFHTMERLDPASGRCIPFRQKQHPKVTDLSYLLVNFGYFVNSSKMYRAEGRANLDLESKERIDCYVHVHHALSGKILYFSEVFGGYRLNSGIGTDKGDKRKTIYKLPTPGMFERVFEALDYARESGVSAEFVEHAKGVYYFHHAYSVLMAGDFVSFRDAIGKCAAKGNLDRAQRFFWTFSRFPRFLFTVVRVRALVRQVLAGWLG